MASWLIVTQEGGEPSVSVQEAHSMIAARLRASIAGHTGTFAEAHQLDDKTAKKLPKDLVGPVLKQREAMRLLKKLG